MKEGPISAKFGYRYVLPDLPWKQTVKPSLVSEYRPLETRLSERYILELSVTLTVYPDDIRKQSFWQIHFTNTQINFTIWTNTFWTRLSEKYIPECNGVQNRRTKEENYAVSLSILWHSSSPICCPIPCSRGRWKMQTQFFSWKIKIHFFSNIFHIKEQICNQYIFTSWKRNIRN